MMFRLWIGLWSSLFCLIIVATDGSAIVRYFTRFTEESFAALIGIIFMYEALKKLYREPRDALLRSLSLDIARFLFQ